MFEKIKELVLRRSNGMKNILNWFQSSIWKYLMSQNKSQNLWLLIYVQNIRKSFFVRFHVIGDLLVMVISSRVSFYYLDSRLYYLDSQNSFRIRKLCFNIWWLSSFKGRVTVSGELMFLASYGNFDVTNTLTLSVYDVTKQVLSTISYKHCNSPAVNI